MFTAAYRDEFYLALRDALHTEVDSWRDHSAGKVVHRNALWERVMTLEETSRNTGATAFAEYELPINQRRGDQLVRLQVAPVL
jgi:hypothetical protein